MSRQDYLEPSMKGSALPHGKGAPFMGQPPKEEALASVCRLDLLMWAPTGVLGVGETARQHQKGGGRGEKLEPAPKSPQEKLGYLCMSVLSYKSSKS